MELFKEKTHTFILRIWIEPREIEGAAAEWRGMVEHVDSGQRKYLNDLDQIIAFIAPYLKEMGIKVPKGNQGRKWRTLSRLALLKRD